MSSSGQSEAVFLPLVRDYPRGHRVARHRHDRGQLIYARSGIMTVITPEGAWVVPSQRAVWVPAEIDHEVLCGTAVSMRTLLIDGAAAAGLPEACVVVHVPPLLRELILAAVAGPPARQVDPIAALILEGIRDGQVAPLHLPEPSDPRLRRITAAITADPGGRRALSAWAREVGASPRTLTRRFLVETGMTFQQWQRQARLLAALVRLAQARPVTTIALDLGYDSPSAFIHAFRRALGTTPGRYFEPRRRGSPG